MTAIVDYGAGNLFSLLALLVVKTLGGWER